MEMTKKTRDWRLKTSRRGWIVWTWGKIGGLMIFTAMFIIMLTAYGFVGSSAQAERANELARSLKDNILDTYNSIGEMSLEQRLPKTLNSENYSVEILDKEGDMAAILVQSKSGNWQISGASSLTVPLSERSFGILKKTEQQLSHICIVKYQGKIYLERSRCS